MASCKVCKLNSDVAEPGAYEQRGDRVIECWCCGRPQTDDQVVRLGLHPEVAICLSCAHTVHQRAREREDHQRPGPLTPVRDGLRAARTWVIHQQLHTKPVIGRPLRWLGRHLP